MKVQPGEVVSLGFDTVMVMNECVGDDCGVVRVLHSDGKLSEVPDFALSDATDEAWLQFLLHIGWMAVDAAYMQKELTYIGTLVSQSGSRPDNVSDIRHRVAIALATKPQPGVGAGVNPAETSENSRESAAQKGPKNA